MPIATKTLTSWDEIHEYDKREWIYRGQASKDRAIKTSIERLFERETFQGDQRERLESESIQLFTRVYHQYAVHVPGNESIVEWLSLMQHYGAPTRLADFTYSIYVAAYFALERAESDCAVWALNANWAVNSSIQALKNAVKTDCDVLLNPAIGNYERVIYRVLFNPPAALCALPANPFRLNERLRIQKGLFVVPGDLASSFMKNLQAMPNWESENHLLKIVIPAGLRRQALEKLFYMNISRTSLFPGLDGYAQSLGVYHPYMNPNWQWGPLDNITVSPAPDKGTRGHDR